MFNSISKVDFIDAVIGNDSEGFPVWESFHKGDIVTVSGSMYRIVEFTVNNTVMVRPHGLGHDPAISAIEFRPESLKHLPKADAGMIHNTGLVVFN